MKKYLVHNVKCHFHFKSKTHELERHLNQDRKKNTFPISKYGYSVTWYIFTTSKIVNITGIKSFTHVKSICKEFSIHFKVKICGSVKIDNSTVKFSLFSIKSKQHKCLDLNTFSKYLKQSCDFSNEEKPKRIILNVHRFPSICILGEGSISIYSTGNVVLLGIRSKERIDFFNELLLDLWKSFNSKKS